MHKRERVGFKSRFGCASDIVSMSAIILLRSEAGKKNFFHYDAYSVSEIIRFVSGAKVGHVDPPGGSDSSVTSA